MRIFFLCFILACSSTPKKSSKGVPSSYTLFKNDTCSQKVMNFLRVRTNSPQNLDAGLFELSQRKSGIKLMTEQWQINHQADSDGKKQMIDFYRNDEGTYNVIKPVSMNSQALDIPEVIAHPKDLLLISHIVSYREYSYQIGHYDVRLTSDGSKIINIERDKLFHCRLERAIYVCECKKYF